MPHENVFVRGQGLQNGWKDVLAAFAEDIVLPRIQNSTALGVWLGDEICCHNSSCWHDQLYPLSAHLRALLGSDALLYTNECGDSIAGDARSGPPLDRIAPDLDLLSIDI